jgi:O-antigen/teichoic acid export membrane protein
MSIPFLLIGPIVHFLFPVVSELFSRNDIKKIQIIHGRFTEYFALFALWVSVFMFQFGEELSILLFSEKFLISGTILQFSAFFLLFNFLAQINFQILAGTGRIRERAKIFLIILPINIILNIILIRYFDTHI